MEGAAGTSLDIADDGARRIFTHLDSHRRDAGQRSSLLMVEPGGVSQDEDLGVSRNGAIGLHDGAPGAVEWRVVFLIAGMLPISIAMTKTGLATRIGESFDAELTERFGDDLLLQVDANAAYTLADAGHLAGLDRYGLLLVEQPLVMPKTWIALGSIFQAEPAVNPQTPQSRGGQPN